MVKYRLLVIVIAACALAAGGIWFFVDARQERAKEFFGTTKKYDMTNGPEMRPRW